MLRPGLQLQDMEKLFLSQAGAVGTIFHVYKKLFALNSLFFYKTSNPPPLYQPWSLLFTNSSLHLTEMK